MTYRAQFTNKLVKSEASIVVTAATKWPGQGKQENTLEKKTEVEKDFYEKILILI